jgi:putative transposase
MKRKRFAPEKIFRVLREADVSLSQGMTVGQICRQLGISGQTYYCWRKQYGGMKISHAKRMKELEGENSRLKKAVAELALDKLILREALGDNYLAPPDAVNALNTFRESLEYRNDGPVE